MNPAPKNMERLLQGIEEIPTIPIISQRVMELSGDKNAVFKDFVEIIEKDQALATKTLRLANSAYYGLLSQVTSLDHAMVILGINEVRSLALGVCVYNFFSESENGAFDRTRFWKHAVICSQVAKLLGARFGLRNDGSLFLSGLVHDIGKVVIDRYFHEEFLQIVEYVSSNKTTFSKAEKELLGTTHYEIAAQLLKQWKFPEEVVTQIQYHHGPWHAKDNGTSSSIIYLANVLTKLAGHPSHPDERRIDLHEFSNSSEFDFLSRSGLDLNYEAIKKLINTIQDIVVMEADKLISMFT
jgi:putative nucleotidyltransferase with HDIG domain